MKQLSLFSDRDTVITAATTRPTADDYKAFVDKFRPKKTTDDCYTPPAVYSAILDWVKANALWREEYEVLRPFYPGGDYLRENYTADTVVVDNPPFSILAQIVLNYTALGVKFFLFAPHLTLFSSAANISCQYIITDASITYENGAIVKTDFITNLLDPEIIITTAPDLVAAVKEANAQREKKKMPVPQYPKHSLSRFFPTITAQNRCPMNESPSKHGA